MKTGFVLLLALFSVVGIGQGFFRVRALNLSVFDHSVPISPRKSSTITASSEKCIDGVWMNLFQDPEIGLSFSVLGGGPSRIIAQKICRQHLPWLSMRPQASKCAPAKSILDRAYFSKFFVPEQHVSRSHETRRVASKRARRQGPTVLPIPEESANIKNNGASYCG